MGRLIDADKLLETLQDLEPHCENKDYEYGMLKTIRYYMPKIINDEPTVFDVDKVVEQLEEIRSKAIDDFANLLKENYDYLPQILSQEAFGLYIDEYAEQLKAGGTR